jgi:hypothetical protein
MRIDEGRPVVPDAATAAVLVEAGPGQLKATDEQIRRAYETLYLSGRMPLYRVARELGISESRLSVRLKLLGLTTRPNRGPLSGRDPVTDEELRQVYETVYVNGGGTLLQMARTVRLGSETVRRRLMALGLPLRPKGPVRAAVAG